MKTNRFFTLLLLSGVLSFNLMGCGIQPGNIKARPSGGGEGNGSQGQDNKPSPGSKVVEAVAALKFQKPTENPAEFENVMKLDVTTAEQAWFSFSLTPKTDGSFFVLLSQIHLTAECDRQGDRTFSRGILFQEILANGARKTVKPFTPSITQYDFKAGKKYYLSYVLADLKKDFVDCKTATLKLATFQQDY